MTIHPFAFIDKNVVIGNDNEIMPNASIMRAMRNTMPMTCITMRKRSEGFLPVIKTIEAHPDIERLCLDVARQEALQVHGGETPVYTLLGRSGPDHAPSFEVSVSHRGRELARGAGHSKKQAEKEAARAALRELGASPD